MKTLKTVKLKNVFFALILVLSVSCAKDGANGADGADGAQGPAGADGNANVISSGWVAYDDANWSALSNEFGISYRNYPISVSEITQDIVDNGVILVYTRFSTDTYVLPFTDKIVGGAENQILSFRVNTNIITIKMRNESGSGDPGTFSGNSTSNQYRYIIIPSGTNKTNVNFKKMSYQEVIDYFNLDY